MVNSVTLAPLGMLQAGAFPVSRRWMNAGVNELWLPRVPLHLFLSPPPLLHASHLSLISGLNVQHFQEQLLLGVFFFLPVFAISYVLCSFKYCFCNLDVSVLKRMHVNIHRSNGGCCFSSPM